jgi:NAD(P)H-hydrate epimerase
MQDLGVPSVLLMERAALAVSAVVGARWEAGGGVGRVVVVCGPGNNGADGVAIARQLHGRAVDVVIALVVERYSETVARQLQMARALGVPTLESPDASAAIVDHGADPIFVDALLGTGSRGAPRGAIASAVQALVRVQGPVIAVDVPTGVDPDTGSVPGDAVRATHTVTFQRSKPGLHVTPGREQAGRVTVAEIGLVPPPEVGSVSLLDPEWVASRLGALDPARHKGERGRVCCVGGSAGTAGALVLAGTGALRAGAGLVTLLSASHESAAVALSERPELMCASLEEPWPTMDALVVGPGLTARPDQEAVRASWLDHDGPAVWDAGGLAVISGPARHPRVITPHPKEAAVLLDRLAPEDMPWTVARVQADRILAARRLARVCASIVVLKGVGTIVARPEDAVQDDVAVCVAGSASLATAGSGDVLAGVTAALLARGLDSWDAARAAVHLHASAGERLGDGPGPLAADVADAVGELMTTPADLGNTPRWPRRVLG